MPPIGKIAAHSAYDMFSWYKYLIVNSHLGFWSGYLFLIAPFPDICLLVFLILKPWSHGQIYSRMQILRIRKFYSRKQICPCDRNFSTFAYTQNLHIRKICTWSRASANLKIYFYLREQNLHTCKSVHVTGKQNLHM